MLLHAKGVPDHPIADFEARHVGADLNHLFRCVSVLLLDIWVHMTMQDRSSCAYDTSNIRPHHKGVLDMSVQQIPQGLLQGLEWVQSDGGILDDYLVWSGACIWCIANHKRSFFGTF